jgi:hypothetical protein
MSRFSALLLATALALVAIAPAHAARPRPLQVLDTDSLLAEEQIDFVLQLARRPNGEAVLIDESASTPRRVTALGLVLPAGPASANFQAVPDLDADTMVLAAIASGDRIHVVELRGLTTTAAVLDVQSLGSIATGSALDLGSVSAETARVWGDPHVDVFETLVVSWSAGGLPAAVAQVDDAWVPVAPLGQYSPDLGESDLWTFEEGWPVVEDVDSLDIGGTLVTLATLRIATGELFLLDESPSTAPRVTPLGYTAPSGTTKGEFLETPDGDVWAAFASSDGIRVLDLGDITVPDPLTPRNLDFLHAGGGWDPTSVRTGIIAILIGLAVEPRPALSVVTQAPDGTSNTVTFGWDGDSFEAVVPAGGGVWTWDTPQ